MIERQADVFQAVADALPHVVWSLDPLGRVAWVNRRFGDYTGVDVTRPKALDATVWA